MKRRSISIAGLLGFYFLMVAAAGAATQIEVLSNRADLISGGEALVEIVPAPPSGSVIALEGSDVTSAFALNGAGRFIGLVTGLAIGSNQLTVTLPDNSGATLAIENHPAQGPVFGGPHIQPWDCTTDANGLGPPTDADCNAPPVVDYLYISSTLPQLGYQNYDVANPPADVALVTNGDGHTVRHIVRRERGAMNRGLYAFAHLHDPDLGEPDPANPQLGFLSKLFYPFEGNAGVKTHQGSMPNNVLDASVLGRGFAMASTSLNVYGHHANTVTSGESMMMLKERIIEQLGPIRFTIAVGSSGGSIQQNMIGNAYPGLINGLIPSLTFPDIASAAFEGGDCSLLEAYWPTAVPAFTETQQQAVDGHGPSTSCTSFFFFAPISSPVVGCFQAPDSRDYNPVTNPDGCRASVQDIQINLFGRRPQDSFGKRSLDNFGVQFGLTALNLPLTDPGKITLAQFLDLNSRIGGKDIDGIPTLTRWIGDPDTDWITYRISQIVDGRGLARAATINLGSIDNFEFHNPFHSYTLEARMQQIGHGDNHVLWHSGPTQLGDLALETMNEWLESIEASGATIDPHTGIDPAVVAAHRPAIAYDSCWFDGTQQPLSACAAQVFGDARLEAGMPATHDNYQCVLKPVDPADYAGAVPPLSPGDIASIEAVFPYGVCDYTVPSHGSAPSVPWLTFEDGPGGEGLPPSPVSTPL